MQVETLKRAAREYEVVYILEPNVSSEEAERVATRVSETIQKLNGKITKVDQWGRRKLAYPIQKNSRGVFVYVRFVGLGDLIAELERNLRNIDAVIRFQSVKRGNAEIELTKVVVNPDEVKFAKHELSTEVDVELSIEEKLNFVARPRAPRQEEDEMADFEVPAEFDNLSSR